jgi:hypothetical protein
VREGEGSLINACIFVFVEWFNKKRFHADGGLLRSASTKDATKIYHRFSPLTNIWSLSRSRVRVGQLLVEGQPGLKTTDKSFHRLVSL